jgi:uncharacterized membrane protein HdeD (DUF308 family)
MDIQSTTTIGSRTIISNVPWWLVLLEGIAAIIIGVLLLVAPGTTVLVLTQILGFYFLISGLFAIISIFMDSSLWGWKLVVGILGILSGIIVIRHPLWSAVIIPTLIVIFLAVQAIINGAIKIYQSITGGGFGTLILGIVNIIIGLILLFNPFMAAYVLPLVLGIFAIIGGVTVIFSAIRTHNQEGAVATTNPPPPTAQPI